MATHFLYQVETILEYHLHDESFGITELCEELGISRVHLHRKLKAASEKSASHYIRSFRLHRAKELLESTNLRVSEVAGEVGFRNIPYFSSSFLDEFGHSPKETRRGY